MSEQLWAPIDVPEKPEAKCPAAAIGTYVDSGKPYLRCGVERKHFAIEDAVVAVLNWCCDEYTDCPVWQAQWEEPDLIKRVHEAQDAEAAAKAEKGLRVPDEQREAELELQHELREERKRQQERKLNEED